MSKKKQKFKLDETTISLSRRLWSGYMSAHWGKIAIAVMFMAIGSGIDGAVVKGLEWVLDRALAEGNESLIHWFAVFFLAMFFIRGTSNFIQATIMHHVGLRVVQRLQAQMMDAFLRIELQYLHDEGTAKQLSRFTVDVTLLRQAVTKVFTSAGKDVVKIVVMIIVMFHMNWKMAAAAAVFFPLSVYPIVRIGKRLRKVSNTQQVESGQMTGILDDSLKNARQVRAYGMEAHEQKQAEGAFEAIYKIVMKSAVVRNLTYPILDTLSGATFAVILLWSGYLILEEQMTIGQFVAFFVAVMTAYQPVRSLANLNATLQEGLAAANRIFSLIDHDPKIKDAEGAKELEPGKGEVKLQDVRFGYEADKDVLDGVELQFPAGKTVALVGPSGSGKSTILNLIPRFYDVLDGKVLVDGQDVRDVTMSSLRRQISLVSQETALFNDTIRGNIAYGRPEAPEEEIVEAAKAAAAHEFIMALPHGYDTQVGEMGVRLSGGQRQRISIARAMLKNAPILLLDEATSALDTESERQVQAALARLMAHRTTIVIAHRLSTIVDADFIYVMDNGRVVEEGNHQSLMAKEGLYANLRRLQFQADDGSGDAAEHDGLAEVRS